MEKKRNSKKGDHIISNPTNPRIVQHVGLTKDGFEVRRIKFKNK